MLKQAEERGIYGEGYAWITTDATTSTGAVAAAPAGDATTARRLISGLLNFYVSPHVTAGFARFTSAWEVQLPVAPSRTLRRTPIIPTSCRLIADCAELTPHRT